MGGMELAYGGAIRDYPTAQVVGWSVIGLGIGAFVATPIASAYGYNRSRPREDLGGRFVPGSVALGMRRNHEGARYCVVDVHLLDLRF